VFTHLTVIELSTILQTFSTTNVSISSIIVSKYTVIHKEFILGVRKHLMLNTESLWTVYIHHILIYDDTAITK